MKDFHTALEYCKTNMLKMTQDECGHRLFCYTKKCFFGDDTWDDVTKSHRGQLYFENKKVNKPFTKIFNVDEVPETEHNHVYDRMENEPYEIYDKANGHLFIVSMFVDSKGEQHVVFSTKGSLPNSDNDLLNNDIRVFTELYGERLDVFCNAFPNTTLMFEAIVEHDKHSLYDLQVEQYGSKNTFVLLGASFNMAKSYSDAAQEYDLNSIYHSKHNNTTLSEDPWVESAWSHLEHIANYIGCPVIKKYDSIEGSPLSWKEHTDREGYVIHFLTDNTRVKVKTNEYWKNRFMKDLTLEKMLGVYVKGGRDLFLEKFPEEIAVNCLNVIEIQFSLWYMNDLIRYDDEIHPFLKENKFRLTPEKRKWLFTESVFTNWQRNYIAAIVDGKSVTISDNKHLREMFVEKNLHNSELTESIKEIVANGV